MSTDVSDKPRKRVKQQRLEGSGFPEVDDELEGAAEEYMKAMRSKNKATEKLNTQKDMLIETMVRRGVSVIKVDDGGKLLRLTSSNSLKTEKIKEVSGELSDPSGDDE